MKRVLCCGACVRFWPEATVDPCGRHFRTAIITEIQTEALLTSNAPASFKKKISFPPAPPSPQACISGIAIMVSR